jgi:iron(III) transport system ATP-binding protein
MVRATVAGTEPDAELLDVAGLRWRIATAQRFAAGQRVEAVVRPESLTFAAGGEGLAGVVESRVYLGAKAEYMISCGGQPMHLVQPNPLASRLYAVGEQVALALPTAGVQLLEAGD